jgi:hypothetical protein
LSDSAYPGCESAYGTYGGPYKSHDSYAAPSVEDGYATWQRSHAVAIPEAAAVVDLIREAATGGAVR